MLPLPALAYFLWARKVLTKCDQGPDLPDDDKLGPSITIARAKVGLVPLAQTLTNAWPPSVLCDILYVYPNIQVAESLELNGLCWCMHPEAQDTMLGLGFRCMQEAVSRILVKLSPDRQSKLLKAMSKMHQTMFCKGKDHPFISIGQFHQQLMEVRSPIQTFVVFCILTYVAPPREPCRVHPVKGMHFFASIGSRRTKLSGQSKIWYTLAKMMLVHSCRCRSICGAAT